MTKLGTCAFAAQIQAIEHHPIPSHPHLRPYVEVFPESYVCAFFLDEELPPPLRRYNGGFTIHENDCEGCDYYTPAGEKLLIRLWRKKRVAKKRRSVKA